MLTGDVILWLLSRDADRRCDIVTAVKRCWQVMWYYDCCPGRYEGSAVDGLFPSGDDAGKLRGHIHSRIHWSWKLFRRLGYYGQIRTCYLWWVCILFSPISVLVCESGSVSVSLYPPLTLSIIGYGSTLWDSANANTPKPLVSLHKRTLKAILLKNTSLAISDYNFLYILYSKNGLTTREFLYTKLWPEKFHPLLRLNFT